MNNGFPELSDSFLLGQDILYSQFNDINFYVEDTDQEHFYFNILSKLFPNVSFEKIFPLNGKDNVVINWFNIPITPEKAKVMLKDLPPEDIDFTKHSKKSGKGGSISYLEFIESALIKKFDTLSKEIGMQAKREISNRFKID